MRALLVDDHRLMRDGLRAILEAEGMEVDDAASGDEALEVSRQRKPQVVVMDISMPGLNGINATQRLLADQPGIKVVALSMHCDQRYVVAMFAAGAVGYLLKTSASDELVQALHTVERGMTYVSPSIGAAVVEHIVSPTQTSGEKALSLREREVLQLIAEGESSKSIAGRLNLAVATVETHRRQIMDKLRLRTIAELTKYAVRNGLTSID